MTDLPTPPKQPMGGENHPQPYPSRGPTQLPPGRLDDAQPLPPDPEPDA